MPRPARPPATDARSARRRAAGPGTRDRPQRPGPDLPAPAPACPPRPEARHPPDPVTERRPLLKVTDVLQPVPARPGPGRRAARSRPRRMMPPGETVFRVFISCGGPMIPAIFPVAADCRDPGAGPPRGRPAGPAGRGQLAPAAAAGRGTEPGPGRAPGRPGLPAAEPRPRPASWTSARGDGQPPRTRRPALIGSRCYVPARMRARISRLQLSVSYRQARDAAITRKPGRRTLRRPGQWRG